MIDTTAPDAGGCVKIRRLLCVNGQEQRANDGKKKAPCIRCDRNRGGTVTYSAPGAAPVPPSNVAAPVDRRAGPERIEPVTVEIDVTVLNAARSISSKDMDRLIKVKGAVWPSEGKEPISGLVEARFEGWTSTEGHVGSWKFDRSSWSSSAKTSRSDLIIPAGSAEIEQGRPKEFYVQLRLTHGNHEIVHNSAPFYATTSGKFPVEGRKRKATPQATAPGPAPATVTINSGRGSPGTAGLPEIYATTTPPACATVTGGYEFGIYGSEHPQGSDAPLASGMDSADVFAPLFSETSIDAASRLNLASPPPSYSSPSPSDEDISTWSSTHAQLNLEREVEQLLDAEFGFSLGTDAMLQRCASPNESDSSDGGIEGCRNAGFLRPAIPTLQDDTDEEGESSNETPRDMIAGIARLRC